MKTTTRREFLQEIAAVALVPAIGSSNLTEPILDIHQHAFYMGRSEQELIAHQKFHGVTITNLLAGDGWMLAQLGGNADCAETQSRYPDLFVRFAVADPIEGRSLDLGAGALQRPATDPLLRRGPSPLDSSWPAPAVKLKVAGLGIRASRGGAIGVGEVKFHVSVDAPEMDGIYKLAQELGVPVLMHFQEPRYMMGLSRFESVLKAYPRVNFIAHATSWWANISADADPAVTYPKARVKRGGLTDRLLADYANVYGDLSANSGLGALTRDPEFAQHFLERHSRKLVWGSDCYDVDGKGTGTVDGYCIAGRCLAALRKLVTNPLDLRRILYDNGAGLLGIK